jgi:hypothetical protein
VQRALKENYCLTVLVTSHTQGKDKSDNLPLGAGKTHFSLYLSWLLNFGDWEIVFNNLKYYPIDIYNMLEPGQTRRRAGVWEDTQHTAPSVNVVPKPIVKLGSKLSVSRPELAVLIMNAPSINDIAAPIRRRVMFEIIISQRGRFEVQKYAHYKNWKNPYQDINRLEYIESGTYPPLPPEIAARYDKWRIEQKMRTHQLEKKEMEQYQKVADSVDKEGQELTLNALIARGSKGRVHIELPKEYGAIAGRNVDIKLSY